MKQIICGLKDGKIDYAEVPIPSAGSTKVVVKTKLTLISPGTEKMLIDFGRSSWLGKAKSQPDKVKQVVSKIKSDGLWTTAESVGAKLNQPIPLGYCCFGEVVEVGSEVNDLSIGDSVVCNGGHAEYVSVSSNFCVKVDDALQGEKAVFAVLGAIALQSVRLLNPSIGETFCVIGMGLVGNLCAQILKANGCNVVGLDVRDERVSMSELVGVPCLKVEPGGNAKNVVLSRTGNQEVDGVIVATATSDNSPITSAAQMTRKRGRIVLAGIAGLSLNRDDFFKKEISFCVSSSYGPGRYDAAYEAATAPYPSEIVRWDAKRNIACFVDLVGGEKINVLPLLTDRISFSDAVNQYNSVLESNESLAVLIDYSEGQSQVPLDTRLVRYKTERSRRNSLSRVSIGVIGAGNYASSTLLPTFSKQSLDCKYICAQSGGSAGQLAKKFGFTFATSSSTDIFEDESVNTVVIATRHDSHCDLLLKALDADKNVFIEKPLCLNLDELEKIAGVVRQKESSGFMPVLMVGFNRRFSPFIIKIKDLLNQRSGPKALIMSVNAGSIDPDHWLLDNQLGGGRLVGECCHYLDLIRFLVGERIIGCSVNFLGRSNKQTFSIDLKFDDGSIATVHYFSNGPRILPKERLEVFHNGSVLSLDNFRKLKGFNWAGFKSMATFKQDKGQAECCNKFIESVSKGFRSPIPFEEIYEVAKVCIRLRDEAEKC